MRNDFNEKKGIEAFVAKDPRNQILPVKGKKEEVESKKKKGIQMRKHYNNNKSEMP